MVEIPNEIWLHISRFIPRDTLRNLFSLNRTFFELAMDERYRVVTIAYIDQRITRKLERLKDPFIAGRVHFLRIRPSIIEQMIDKEKAVARRHKTWQWKLRATTSLVVRHLKFKRKNGAKVREEVKSSDEIAQLIMDFVAGLSNLREFGINWEYRFAGAFNPPFLAAAWPVLGPKLRKLSLCVSLSRLRPLLSPAQGLETLQELDIVLSAPWAVSMESGDGKAVIILMTFINGLTATLQSLSISSLVHVDLSPLFNGLGKFPRLRKLNLSIPLDHSHLSDPSGVRRLLNDHGNALEHVVLRPNRCYSIPAHSNSTGEWIVRGLSGVSLPRLQTLEIGLALLPENLDATFIQLRSFTDMLTCLILTDAYLTHGQITTVVTTLANRPVGFELQKLRLNARTLSRRLVDLLANTLTSLKILHLGIGSIEPDEILSNELQSAGQPSLSQAELFCHEIIKRRYPDWQLRDITISMCSCCCGSTFQYPLMRALAACVPAIQSFGEQGNMLVPDPEWSRSE